MHVLVTGATGFLGRHLTRHLVNRGFAVTCLVRSTSCTENLRSLATKFRRLNILQIDGYWSLESLDLRHIQAVIHTATNYGRGKSSISDIYASNVLFPLEIFKAAAQASVPLFLNTDTYFSKNPHATGYLSDYVESKKFLSESMQRLNSDVTVITLQLEHMYGPFDHPWKFIQSAVDSIVVRKDPEFQATIGRQLRDFIHVDDVVRAYDTVLDSFILGPGDHGDVFEIGTGAVSEVRTVLLLMKQLSQSTTSIEFGALPYRSNEVMSSCANDTFRKTFGWQAEIGLEEGLRSLIREYCQ